MASLNLARSPFVNRRPLLRTGRFLAVIGVALLIVNGVLFWRYLSSSADLRGRLREVSASRDEELRELGRIEQELRSLELDEQNQRVRFLNEKIAQRSFGWSQLFEELGSVLPRDVKLYNLSPTVERRRRRRGEAKQPDWERVVLVFSGVAKDTEPLLELIDGLFEHPAFEEPRLSAESREESGQIRFELTAIYRPGGDLVRSTSVQSEAQLGSEASSESGSVDGSELQADFEPRVRSEAAALPEGDFDADSATQETGGTVQTQDPFEPNISESVREVASAEESSQHDPTVEETGEGRTVPGVEPRQLSRESSSRPMPRRSESSSGSVPGALPIRPPERDRGAVTDPRERPIPTRPGTDDPDVRSRPLAPQPNASSPPGGGGGR